MLLPVEQERHYRVPELRGNDHPLGIWSSQHAQSVPSFDVEGWLVAILKSSISRITEGDGDRNTDKRLKHSEAPRAGHPHQLYFLISSKAPNSDAPPLLQMAHHYHSEKSFGAVRFSKE